jgi:hypothetical protein
VNCFGLVLEHSCHSEYDSYFAVYISVKVRTDL